MKHLAIVAGLALVTATPALAEGDAAAGEAAFRQCTACHVVADDAGNVIAGRGRNGPNLYGLPGRVAGSVDGFRYGPSLPAAGEAGLVWDAASFAAYSADPRGFLQEYLGDSGARSTMSFRLRSGAEDIWAFLESVSP